MYNGIPYYSYLQFTGDIRNSNLSVHSGLASKSQTSVSHIISNGCNCESSGVFGIGSVFVSPWLWSEILSQFEKKLSFSSSSLEGQIGEKVLCDEKKETVLYLQLRLSFSKR